MILVADELTRPSSPHLQDCAAKMANYEKNTLARGTPIDNGSPLRNHEQ
jgi:hypothetical protein